MWLVLWVIVTNYITFKHSRSQAVHFSWCGVFSNCWLAYERCELLINIRCKPGTQQSITLVHPSWRWSDWNSTNTYFAGSLPCAAKFNTTIAVASCLVSTAKRKLSCAFALVCARVVRLHSNLLLIAVHMLYARSLRVLLPLLSKSCRMCGAPSKTPPPIPTHN